MLTYVARRIIYMVIIMLAMSVFAFIIIQLPPGDYLTIVIQTLKTRGIQVDAAMIRHSKVWDMLKHLPIPIIVIVIGTAGTAGLIRIMRGGLLDELQKQYVITARTKGVSERRLLFKYPVRLAINPIISTVGWTLPAIVSGETITAIVLSLPTTRGQAPVSSSGGQGHSPPLDGTGATAWYVGCQALSPCTLSVSSTEPIADVPWNVSPRRVRIGNSTWANRSSARLPVTSHAPSICSTLTGEPLPCG